MYTEAFVTFAEKFNVAVEDAYVIPATFERAAEKMNMALGKFLAEATYLNMPLGEYMAGVCKTVAQKMREDNA